MSRFQTIVYSYQWFSHNLHLIRVCCLASFHLGCQRRYQLDIEVICDTIGENDNWHIDSPNLSSHALILKPWSILINVQKRWACRSVATRENVVNSVKIRTSGQCLYALSAGIFICYAATGLSKIHRIHDWQTSSLKDQVVPCTWLRGR
jgi:hypothetical protein